MEQGSLEGLFAQARDALARTRVATGVEARALALDFGMAIGRIGRRLFVDPARAAEVRDFVGDTAAAIVGHPKLWMWFDAVDDASEPLNAEPDLYIKALRMRSDLEFFREMYRGSAAGQIVDGLDTDEADARLEKLAPHYYVADVPDDIPREHVWWHRHDRSK